ncbi:MAG: glycerol-3-phosphate 1-O-acyltransferase PlsY [Lactobacillus sp.]|nr:glycerol-3-phosphate 1-O-acyltransferase PlsY [Lactobacillus sp.]
MSILKISLLILSYLIGSFPTGVVISKSFFHKDIRDYGSGNIGTTNTFRVLGKKAGVIVLIFDFFKGTVCALLPMFFNLEHSLAIFCGLAAVLGHAFSIFLKFKGGKSVATTAGFILGYNLQYFICCFFVFIPLLLITSTVSLSALLTMPIIVIISLFFHDLYLTILMAFILVLIYVSHRENIKRIIHGKENHVNFGLYYWLVLSKKGQD